MDLAGEGTLDSSCGKYRYVTWTQLGGGTKGTLLLVSLQPLTGSASANSAFEKAKAFAAGLGYGTMAVVSLFSALALSKDDAQTILDPIGPETDRYITELAAEASLILLAWGDYPRIGPRVTAFLRLTKTHDLFAVQVSRNGAPAHPLAWKMKAPKLFRSGIPSDMPIAG
jgi:hypothetical protein